MKYEWAIDPNEDDSTLDQHLYLDGGVILCECPDCHFHVSVRLWLMMVDCWNCGSSFELAEFEPQAERIPLKRLDGSGTASAKVVRQQQSSSPPATAVPSGDVAVRKPPERVPPRQVPVPGASVLSTTFFRRRAWDWLSELPAWLMSLVLHLALLLLLALMLKPVENESPGITLAMVIGKNDTAGDSPAMLTEENAFDRIAPTLEQLQEVRWEDATVVSREALQLRLDPAAYSKHLPKLQKVITKIESDPTAGGTVVTRDPRLRDRILYNEGGTSETEAAVARGLYWLASQQQEDGSWKLRRPGTSVAGTGLALLPFLGAGQTHKYGHYQHVAASGINYLLNAQRKNGDLRANSIPHFGMYAHGQATIVLCEALSMTKDAVLRSPAQRAVDFIVRAQHPSGGGWRYAPRERGDTSVLGWQLMALQSARAAGLRVPQETLDMAGGYLDRAGKQGGALYGYQPGQAPTATMTAEGLLCRIYLGWPADHRPLLEGARFIAENPLPARHEDPYYFWYYATQTLHHLGGPMWENWNEEIREQLIDRQTDTGPQAGSWPADGPHGREGTEIYSTSLAVCTLEVYYRHAPIFRRLDVGR